MSTVPCLLCGEPAAAAFTATDRNRQLSDERFTYYRCSVCGTLSLSPLPTDLGRYYPPSYYLIPETRERIMEATGPEMYKLDIIRRFVNGGRLVEIGPAVGAFSAAAQEAGFDTSAIEMDAACSEFLRSVVGIRVQETDDPIPALAADGPFDVVAMWHVIEHVPNPGDLLRAAIEALEPGGIVALAAPNPAALELRLLGSRWTHVDAPRHLSLMPAEALAEIGRRYGAEPVLLTTTDPGSLGWNVFGWRESFAKFGRGRYSREILRRFGSLVARLFAPVERRGFRGATYTLVLRKPL